MNRKRDKEMMTPKQLKQAAACVRQMERLKNTMETLVREASYGDVIAEPVKSATGKVVKLNADAPGSLKHALVDSGRFGEETVSDWNALVFAGIKAAVRRGLDFSDLGRLVPKANIIQGSISEKGFKPVAGTNLSLQYTDADKAWANALVLSKKLRCEIQVKLHWENKNGAAHPGEQGVLNYRPPKQKDNIMSREAIEFFRKHLKMKKDEAGHFPGGVETFIQHLMQKGQQNVHTPFALCREIIGKLKEYTTLSDKKIAVLFNVEFLHVLLNDFGVSADNIFMFADSKVKFEFCQLQYKMKPGVNLFLLDIVKTIETGELHTIHEGKVAMKFDVVCGNPPYQNIANTSSNAHGGKALWSDFVRLVFDKLTHDDSIVVLITPISWLNGKSKEKYGSLLKEYYLKYQILHLEINTANKYFEVGSKFSWYVIQKHEPRTYTTVRSVAGHEEVEIQYDFRNGNLPFYPTIFTKESVSIVSKIVNEKSKIGFERSSELHTGNHPEYFKVKETGGGKSKWSTSTDEKYPYPVYHTSGRMIASNRQHSLAQKPKIIGGLSGYFCPINDDGGLSFTQDGFYVLEDNKKKRLKIVKLCKSKLYQCFLNLVKYCGYTNADALYELPYVDIDINFSDEDLYAYFRLTPEEVALVEEMVKQ